MNQRSKSQDDLIDWERINRMTDSEIRENIRSDPDAVPELLAADFKRMRVVYPAEAIVRLREKLGLSRLEFATLIGVHVTTLGRWERGLSRPSQPIHNLMRLLERDPDAVRFMRHAA